MTDWQVGDLAVCVNVEPIDDNEPRHVAALWQLKKGQIYKVKGWGMKDGLLIEGATAADEPLSGWHQDRFRKIKPDTEPANADDAAWLKDLLKPKAPVITIKVNAP